MAGLFQVQHKASGQTVDVYGTKPELIGNTPSMMFYVYDIRIGRFEWVPAALFAGTGDSYTPVIRVEDVTLDVFTLTLDVGGDSQTVTATIVPADAENKTVSWHISDPTYATITPSGLTCEVTPVRAGNVILTCITEDNTRTAEARVFVLTNEILVNQIEFLPTSLTLDVGDTGTITAITGPTNAVDRIVTFSIIDGGDKISISQLSNNIINVRALEDGTGRIRATARDDGKFYADYEVLVTATVANVSSYSELTAAVANQNISTINILEDFAITNTVTFDRTITFNGRGHVLSYTGATAIDGLIFGGDNSVINNINMHMTSNDSGWQGLYGIQVYDAVGVTLNGVISSGEDGGILINGSTVTMRGNINLSDNQFGGIEVSRGSLASRNSILNVSAATLINTSEAYSYPTIWVVNGQGSVTGADGLHTIQLNGQTQYYLRQENTTQGVPVTGITLAPTTFAISAGQSQTFTPTILPSNASNKNVLWESNNDTVMTIDNGMGYGVGGGSVTITATTQDGGFTATSTGSVEDSGDIPVTGIGMSNIFLSVPTNGDVKKVINFDIQPANATNKELIFIQDPENMVTFTALEPVPPYNSSYEVAGLATPGQVSIEIRAVNPGDPEPGGWMSIEVTDGAIPMEGITLNKRSIIFGTLQTYHNLQVAFNPVNVTNTDLTWTTNDPTIVTVAGNSEGRGILFSTEKNGTATITVTTADGGFSASVPVTILEDYIPVNEIIVEDTSIILGVGELTQLTVTFVPANASNKNLTYRSDQPNIATISDQGDILGVSPGTTDIRVISEDGWGGIQGYTRVHVVPNEVENEVTGINISPNEWQIGINQDDPNQSYWSFSADIEPENADIKFLTWSAYPSHAVRLVPNFDTQSVTVYALEPNDNIILTATANDGSGVTGTAKIETYIDTTYLSFQSNWVRATAGTEFTIGVIVEPPEARDKDLLEYQTDNQVVMAAPSGIPGDFVANVPGTGWVQVSTPDGRMTDFAIISVVDSQETLVPVDEVSIQWPDTLNLQIFDAIVLTTSVSPSNANDYRIVYGITGDANAFTVNESQFGATITAGPVPATGILTITAEGQTGTPNIVTSVVVNVKNEITRITDVILSDTVKVLSLTESFNLGYSLDPANADEVYRIDWHNNNRSVVSIIEYPNGILGVIAESVGEAIITITLTKQNSTIVQSNCTVTVIDQEPARMAPASVSAPVKEAAESAVEETPKKKVSRKGKKAEK